MNLTPRQKLLGAGLLLGVLLFIAATQGGWSLTSMARLVLGLAACLGLFAWVWRQRRPPVPGRFLATPRLQVLQRVGLSQRNGLALVELDGQAFIVVHGDGFATVRRAPRRPALLPRQQPELAREGMTQ